MPPNVPACKEADNGSAGECQYGVVRGKGTDRKGWSVIRHCAETSLHRDDLPHRSDLANWTKKSRHCRHIIRAEIEHGTGALLIKQSWIGVPMLHALRHDCCQTGDDLSHPPLVDQSFGGLQASAEDGIRRATYTQILCLSLLNQRNGVLKGGCQGLLTIDVLSSGERGSCNFFVANRQGQIEYDLDVVGSQKKPDTWF